MTQSDKKARRRKRCCPAARRSIEYPLTRQPRTCLLNNINSPSEVQKRRRALIAKAAYHKWLERKAAGLPANATEDWLTAEHEVEASEFAAKEEWKFKVCRIIISAMSIATGTPVLLITPATPVPKDNNARWKMYGLIVAAIEKRQVSAGDREDGYASTFGELVGEVFSHNVWVKYLAG